MEIDVNNTDERKEIEGLDDNDEEKMTIAAAIDSKNYEALRRLLERGEDPNISYSDCEEEESHMTPINHVIDNNDATALHILMSHGCSINGDDRECESPLVCAIMAEHLVYEILSYNPDLTRKEGDWLPIPAALCIHPLKQDYDTAPNFELATELLRRGAELNNTFTDYGNSITSVQVAIANRMMNVVHWLLKLGAIMRSEYGGQLDGCSPLNMMTVAIEERDHILLRLLADEFTEISEGDQIRVNGLIIETDDVDAYKTLESSQLGIIDRNGEWCSFDHAIDCKAVNMASYIARDRDKISYDHLYKVQRYVTDGETVWTTLCNNLIEYLGLTSDGAKNK